VLFASVGLDKLDLLWLGFGFFDFPDGWRFVENLESVSLKYEEIQTSKAASLNILAPRILNGRTDFSSYFPPHC
jgi:hypothetical protein